MKTMDELKAKYARQLKEYEDSINGAISTQDVSKIDSLKQMNMSLSKTLNEMIEKLTFLKKETPQLVNDRDELIARLRQIQLDYNGLRVNTDALETLRRIRQQENGEVKRELYWYILFFLGVCIVIVMYLVFMPQTKDRTATSANSPPMMAALV
jgi:hypothetical protein